jgi:amino acid permease
MGSECFDEMVRFSSEWVNGALGFAMVWNFFLKMAFLVPFVAMNYEHYDSLDEEQAWHHLFWQL